MSEVPFKSSEPHETCAQSRVCVGSHMTTTEQDNDTSTRNHSQPRKARAGALMAHPSCLGGSSYGWVSVNTQSTPLPTTVGRLWVAQQHHTHTHTNSTNLAVIDTVMGHVSVHVDSHFISCYASLCVSSGEPTLAADACQKRIGNASKVWRRCSTPQHA